MNMVGDDSMVKAFLDGRDIHVETAKSIFDKEVPTDKERDAAKTFNYATVYGQGEWKARVTLSEQLDRDISRTESTRILELFRKQWPGISYLQAAISDRHKARGFLTTLHGRHLHVEFEHKQMNALIQGTAADIMREAVVKVWNNIKSLASHIVNVVHDELILDCISAEIASLSVVIPPLMKYASVDTIIPVEVSVEYSETNWAEKKPYEV